MYLTDKEAEKKYCVQSVGSKSTELMRCEGSRCMAWRWASGYAVFPAMPKTLTKQPPLPAHVPPGYEFVPYREGEMLGAHWRPTPETMAVRGGFCGLAGVPVTNQ